MSGYALPRQGLGLGLGKCGQAGRGVWDATSQIAGNASGALLCAGARARAGARVRVCAGVRLRIARDLRDLRTRCTGRINSMEGRVNRSRICVAGVALGGLWGGRTGSDSCGSCSAA